MILKISNFHQQNNDIYNLTKLSKYISGSIYIVEKNLNFLF
jgi:hypothetical protein